MPSEDNSGEVGFLGPSIQRVCQCCGKWCRQIIPGFISREAFKALAESPIWLCSGCEKGGKAT